MRPLILIALLISARAYAYDDVPLFNTNETKVEYQAPIQQPEYQPIQYQDSSPKYQQELDSTRAMDLELKPRTGY